MCNLLLLSWVKLKLLVMGRFNSKSCHSAMGILVSEDLYLVVNDLYR